MCGRGQKIMMRGRVKTRGSGVHSPLFKCQVISQKYLVDSVVIVLLSLHGSGAGCTLPIRFPCSWLKPSDARRPVEDQYQR